MINRASLIPNYLISISGTYSFGSLCVRGDRHVCSGFPLFRCDVSSLLCLSQEWLLCNFCPWASVELLHPHVNSQLHPQELSSEETSIALYSISNSSAACPCKISRRGWRFLLRDTSVHIFSDWEHRRESIPRFVSCQNGRNTCFPNSLVRCQIFVSLDYRTYPIPLTLIHLPCTFLVVCFTQTDVWEAFDISTILHWMNWIVVSSVLVRHMYIVMMGFTTSHVRVLACALDFPGDWSISRAVLHSN